MTTKNFKVAAEDFIDIPEAQETDKETIKNQYNKSALKTNPVTEADNIAELLKKGYVLTKEPKTKHMQLLVRPFTAQALKNEAKRQGKSLNEFVNGIFEEYIENNSLQ